MRSLFVIYSVHVSKEHKGRTNSSTLVGIYEAIYNKLSNGFSIHTALLKRLKLFALPHHTLSTLEHLSSFTLTTFLLLTTFYVTHLYV